MKLYELPRDKGIRIKAETRAINEQKLGDYIIFHHIDGMYSYCTVENAPGEICHLSANQEIKYHEEDKAYHLVEDNK